MGYRYINVILPLKLEWEPYYRVENENVTVGSAVKVIFSGKIYYGTVSAVDVTPPQGMTIRGIITEKTDLYDVSEKELKFWRMLADYYMCSVGEVFKAAMPGLKIPQRNSAAKKTVKKPEEVVLSPAQIKAADEIRTAFSQGKTALLHGVTGAGKTEIYAKLAAETLARGKNVLYLVPEIAVSRQLEDRITEIIGSELLVFHSAETPGRRKRAAAAIKEAAAGGGTYMVLGTRSALFLPHENLGLVIVDEEQDRSYKQDSPAPRYNGRDAAIMLCRLHGGNAVLGTATPSLESLFNVKFGKYAYVRLDKKFYDGQVPDVEIIDTAAERKKRGMKGNFSIKLIKEISGVLNAGEQVMILRGRRSYSPVLQCDSCGHIMKCPKCNVSLSLHKKPDSMVCHHCGHTEKYTGACPECGGILHGLGSGTQKIEEEARELFPDAEIARLDSDSVRDRKFEVETIRRFSKGEIDILIGTQIISKGFDFPKLTLVAAINADSILSVQDFRADERAFQVLEQFRGRCGRREKQGRLVIQTSRPEHPVYQKLSKGSDESLYGALLDERKMFGFPPFSRVINIIMKDVDIQRLEALSWSLAADLRRMLGGGAVAGGDGAVSHGIAVAETAGTELIAVANQGLFEKEEAVTGPFAPLNDKIDGNYIRIIRLNLTKDKSLGENKAKVAHVVEAFKKDYKYAEHIAIDVDPL